MSSACIETHGLCKRYGTLVALASLDLTVERGSVFGLLGRNGAGKSTTFNILCGWTRSDSGQALVLGTHSHASATLAGRLGAMPQDAAFPGQMPVWRQLAHYAVLSGTPRHEARKEAERVLAMVGLLDIAGRPGKVLSHGMQKRVALAQALLGEPELLLLDEPTAGLDPAAARQIKDLIASLAPHTTVVLSSHNLAEVQEICTHGAILERGHLVAAGTISALTRRGHEISIELGGGMLPPLAALQQALAGCEISLTENRTLKIVGPQDSDAARIIAKALRLLLDADVAILGVGRGTTLERAYIEATSQPNNHEG